MIVKCLYDHIKEIAKIIKNIEKIKENAKKVLQDIENSRSKIQGNLPSPMIYKSDIIDDYSEQNSQLLVQLNKENDLIEKTRETALQLGELLRMFGQKVSEQEYMSFNILREAEDSVGYMKTANYHLNSANERSKGMEKIWIAYFISMTLILIFYDWWTAKIVYITT